MASGKYLDDLSVGDTFETGGITFTYGGLKVDNTGAVLDGSNTPISGLYACGELVGGVFFNGYPGGSGLTSGAVFGRRAGYGAAS